MSAHKPAKFVQLPCATTLFLVESVCSAMLLELSHGNRVRRSIPHSCPSGCVFHFFPCYYCFLCSCSPVQGKLEKIWPLCISHGNLLPVGYVVASKIAQGETSYPGFPVVAGHSRPKKTIIALGESGMFWEVGGTCNQHTRQKKKWRVAAAALLIALRTNTAYPTTVA